MLVIRYFSCVTSPRQLLLLTVLAAVIGIAGGAAAYVLIHLIALLSNLAFFHRVGWKLPSFTHLHRSPMVVLVAASILIAPMFHRFIHRFHLEQEADEKPGR